MRCKPSYWLLGLVPIAILSWIVAELERDRIESDLARRTQDALARAGLARAAPIFSGRDAVITGRAAEDSEPARALASVRDVWGVRVAHGRIDLIDRVDKYLWSATTRGDGRVVLGGFVPNDDVRAELVKAARTEFSSAKIVDEMTLARGAPDRDAWLTGAVFGMRQLAKLKRGSTELDALDISLVGEAATSAAYTEVRSALKSGLPGGIKLALEKVAPPRVDPFTWTAEKSAQQVALSGFVPSEKLRGDLSVRAKSAFSGLSISDRTDVADGAPEGWGLAAQTVLDQLAVLKSGTANFKGRDLSFAGEAADEATAVSVRKALRGVVPQNFKLNEQIRYPKPTIAPADTSYVMAIASEPVGIEVTGSVPSEAARVALVDAIRSRFPGKNVLDKLQVAAGAPEGWQQCIVAGLAALPRLKAGKAVLSDRQLTVTGSTDDYAVAQGVPPDVKAAASPICEAEANIQFDGQVRTNLSWKAVYENAGQVSLQGEVPDDQSRARLVESAQSLFPSTSISDKMTIAGAPSDVWLPVAMKALAQLAQLHSGEVSIDGPSIKVKGLAESDQVASSVRSAVTSGLPEGFKGTHAIEVMSAVEKEADNCQDLMRETTARGLIQFERAKADLTSESAETLKELAEIANACPRFRIEIEGHTDAEGTDERNQRLSDRRALAVANFLSQTGVDAKRLTTVGYGATRPVSDNETEEGRARNRRIEFTVKTK